MIIELEDVAMLLAGASHVRRDVVSYAQERT